MSKFYRNIYDIATNLAAGVVGILGIANGGTNSSTALNNERFIISSGGKIVEVGATNAQTGTTYTPQASDFGKLITFNNASAITLILPQQSTLTTTSSFKCAVRNLGAGAVTIVKEGAETLDGNTLLNQYAEAIIERPSTTKWSVFGGTATLNSPGTNFFIQAVANNTYEIIRFGTPLTILGVREKARALTTAGTFSININGVAVTSLSAVVPTTAGSYTAASGANTVARGDIITIVYSGTTAILDHTITLDYTEQF